jgi:hypothetical protein
MGKAAPKRDWADRINDQINCVIKLFPHIRELVMEIAMLWGLLFFIYATLERPKHPEPERSSHPTHYKDQRKERLILLQYQSKP